MKKYNKSITKMVRSCTVIIMGIWLTGCATLDYSQQAFCYQAPLPTFNNINIALVLGGGGAKGLGHVGVIEELLAAGIYPDLIVGCSAGAIVGALFADNPNVYHLKSILFEKKREHLLDISLLHIPFGLSNAASLDQFLKEHLRSKTFEELKIPFVAMTTSLEFGDLVPFGKGELVKPVRASAAFPGVFLPVKIRDGYYLDGAIADPVPVEVARALGAKFIIAVDLSGNLTKSLPNHGLGVLKRSIEIQYIHHCRTASSKADYAIKIPFEDVGTFDDSQNEKIYEIGRATARKAIPSIQKLLKRGN
ncbi:MAG: patatin-like phospholipase family protein [Alphaproteobacteria bacterium]|jgi:NTE family protein|nr:patatin-like phospholipase family protein [Alphaproteobacteria bacterium]